MCKWTALLAWRPGESKELALRWPLYLLSYGEFGEWASPSRWAVWEVLHLFPLLFVVPRSQEPQIDASVVFHLTPGKGGTPTWRRGEETGQRIGQPTRDRASAPWMICQSPDFTAFGASSSNGIFFPMVFLKCQMSCSMERALSIHWSCILTNIFIKPLCGNYAQDLR